MDRNKKILINTTINDLLGDKKTLLTITYFKLQKLLEKKYGKNTIVLMEIGTFFEVYEINNQDEQIGKAKEIAQLLNIQLTRKNKTILENCAKNPIMAGVPAIALDKYLERIINEQKYTIAIIRQRGVPPNVNRYLDTIISPGTNFDFVLDQDENNITSLLVDCNKNIYSLAYSAIDVTTGKCFFNEVNGTSEDKFYALDEVFNYMNMHKTNEVIITFTDKSINQKEVISYLELANKNFHVSAFRPKIIYQNELFKNVFNIESLLTSIEHLDMERVILASECLAILIDFIIGHDYQIVQKLSFPIKLDISKYVYLGNNALEQLNIIENSNHPSVIKLLNNTATAMGKRLLKERLSHPIKDEKELLRRYALSNDLYDYHTPIESELSNIYDIERLTRRIKLEKLHPFELNYLYDSLLSIKELVKFMENYKFFEPPCSVAVILKFIESIDETFDLSISGKYMLKDIENNMICEGINIQIDELNIKNIALENKLNILKNHILSFLKKSDENFVHINRLDKEGFFITLTKSRFNLIKDALLNSHILIDNELLLFKDFKIKTQTNYIKIKSDFIENISDKYVHNLRKIIELNKLVFKEKLIEFEKKFASLLEDLVLFIAEIDLSVSNIKTAKKYNYVCPKIVKTKDDENFLELIDLRHPLIEANEEQGVYVPNDIILGQLSLSQDEYKNNIIIKNSNPINQKNNQIHGVLLYGINSSGKSSLMKSIGIAVVLAQAGFFVPAKIMRFSIFNAIFTRISGADNIAKGLSSFAVEMLELKNIFNRANQQSLILGDEISHSTETMSGLSIVASAILKLAKLESLFLFATHLHALPNIKEIKNLKNIISLHLSVMYEDKEDKLIFNRKLQIGSGSSVYGLEYARSLHMDKDFLKMANDIRKRLADDYAPIERLQQHKNTKYNKNLLVSFCVICGQSCEEVHHIKEQARANKEGFVEHMNVNHKYNLIPLCKKHHKMVHDGSININGFISTSKGLELHYTHTENE